MTSPKIEYVIFDMDGLLIDSERVYTQVNRQLLAQHGEEFTWDVKAELMGKHERDAAAYLVSLFPNIPWTVDTYLAQRNAGQDALWPTVRPLPGVLKLVKHLHSHQIPIAVATSSTRKNFVKKTGHLEELFGLFEGRVICGDDVREGGMRGKPWPDIFLKVAQDKLGRLVGAAEGECTEEEKESRKKGLVFEDAIIGMQAGKRAGMSVIWVPDANLLDVDYDGAERPDQILKSIEEFEPEGWGLPPY